MFMVYFLTLPIFLFTLFGRTIKLVGSIRQKDVDQIKVNLLFMAFILLLGIACFLVLQTMK